MIGNTAPNPSSGTGSGPQCDAVFSNGQPGEAYIEFQAFAEYMESGRAYTKHGTASSRQFRVAELDIIQDDQQTCIGVLTNIMLELTPESWTNIQWKIEPVIPGGATFATGTTGPGSSTEWPTTNCIWFSPGSVVTNYLVTVMADGSPICYDHIKVKVLGMEIVPTNVMSCACSTDLIEFSLTSESWPEVVWEVSPSQPNGAAIAVQTPTTIQVAPGEIGTTYVVRAVSTSSTQCCAEARLSILKVDIAMDGDRDGSIRFDDPDDAEYLFWVNNDYDVKHQNEGIWQQDDDDPAGNPDCNDNYIGNVENSSIGTCERDLEDFTRLHIQVDDNTATMSGITYWLKFENVTSGSPSVNVFEAVDTSSDYVSDSSVAAQQIQKLNLTQSGVGASEVQLDAQYIKTGNQISPFIVEGRSAGTGDLTFIVKKDGNEVCKKAVTLELHDMPWFYDVYSVGVSSGIRWEVQIPTAATHSQTASYSPATDEKFLLVHGWNMNAAEKTQWIQTVFKRLWWQGYQGSVALFDWPTLSDMNFWDVLAGAHHFDNSEFRSWLSSDALIGVFNTLNGSGNLRVLAHSMGNVVAGEAIRRYTGADLHTYLACQSALSAHFYDNTIAANHPCRHQGYDWFFPNTPDIMGHFSTGDANSNPHMTDNDTHVSNMQSYFNADDWALDFWEINNVLKPDGLTPYLFGYDGSEDHYQEGTDQFSRGPIDNPYEVLSVSTQRQRYMIFSYCAESRSRALGQTANGEFNDWDLHANMGYDDQHYSHSREFRSNIADEWDFWLRVFGACQFQSP